MEHPMKDFVEGFISDIAFDEGMGFSLGIGEPKGPEENARVRLAEYEKRVRHAAAASEADADEVRFLAALERRVADEVAKTKDPEAKDHLVRVLRVITAEQARL